MPLNDPELLGNVLRGAVALGVMMLASGAAARVCHDRTGWMIAAGSFVLVFLWLLAGVVPHPHQAGLLYAVQWGVFGAGVYAGVRAVRIGDPPDADAPGPDPPDPEPLLAFWFGDAASSAEAAGARSRVWFAENADFDAEIRARFADWPTRARDGEFDAWTATPRGSLALILCLDQLPRNLHRGRPESYATDARAVEVAEAAVAQGDDDELEPVEAAFVYLPFEHAEDAALQARSVACFERLRQRGPAELAALLDQYLDYAERHRRVIERFGRFPHRNAVLGRPSTDEETRWLAEGGDDFGGGGDAT